MEQLQASRTSDAKLAQGAGGGTFGASTIATGAAASTIATGCGSRGEFVEERNT